MEENLIPEQTSDNDRIIQVNIEEQMKTAYIDYSMSVIVGRALPDARDGFKPVHRRVLFAMNELGNNFNKPYKKSARIVGEVMGKFHPHGDASIYDTLVRMAQDWTMRYTLVDGQGNFGNQDGDPPAAMRYTEARLQKIAEAMIDDIEKDTVDFQLNFDDSLKEPTVLPTRIPQLLVNGSSGIAVGMATNVPPHNLTEVLNACLLLLDNPKASIDDIIQIITGPDFPTGGVIIGKDIIIFHGVYWPAILMALNITPPKNLLVHGWWLAEQEKMSKSVGNVIDPYTIKEKDYLRYLCLKLRNLFFFL